jgi:hypothetical protein
MEEGVIVIPDVTDLVRQHNVEEKMYTPDGTLLMKPYEVIVENPLIMNRKKWRLFANYVPVENYPDQDRWIAKLNTTGQLVENRDVDLAWMLYYIRAQHPGATVEEVVNWELARVVEDTGDFKDDDEMGAYAMTLYLGLAYAIKYGLLILVKD